MSCSARLLVVLIIKQSFNLDLFKSLVGLLDTLVMYFHQISFFISFQNAIYVYEWPMEFLMDMEWPRGVRK